MEFVDIFPATIAVAELKTLTPDIIARAKEMIDLDHVQAVRGDGSYTSEQQLLNKLLFRDVKQEILGMCREFAKAHSHQVEDIAICNSWGNVVAQGENIHYHMHNNAYISGSFYLTEGSHFNILNQHHSHLFGLIPARIPGDNYRNMESFVIRPKPARIILFPSNLLHCVLPSESAARRYSIAFNAIPVGKIGSVTSLMEIRVPDEHRDDPNGSSHRSDS